MPHQDPSSLVGVSRCMNRRHWIASAAAGCGLVIAGSQLASAEAEPPMAKRLRVGCSGRSLHRQLPTAKRPGKMSLAQFVRRCREWGCDCVEMLDVSFPQTDDAFLASLRREAFLQSIDLSGASVYTDFLHSKKSARDTELEKVRRWIDYTARMGASLLVVFPGLNRRDLAIAEAVRRVTDAVARLADHAERRGVLLGLENHGMFRREPLSVLEVVDKINHPWVGVNLDTGNFLEKPYENMAALVSKAVNCHLKLEVRDGKKTEPADLGRKFRILREGGFGGCVTLQYELSGDPLREVPEYLKKIRALADGTLA